LFALIAVGVIGGSIAIAMTTMIRDDATTAIAEQNRIRLQYEQQIAQLHRQMDALVSQQLVERELLNNQVAELLERQGDLIERQQLLTGLANDALAAGVDVLPMLAPVPITNPLRNPTAEPGGVGGPIDPTTTGAVEPQAALPHSDALQAVEATAEWLADSQLDALALLADEITGRTASLAGLLSELGYRTSATGGIGGPFGPAFGEEALELVASELQELERLQQLARGLPIGQPLARMEVTSSYGSRLDPFLGERAMHTGTDFRATTGTSVLATGPGTVIAAGPSGGYGKLIEIDHGNGVTTRYAHLSSILVEVGDVVTIGEIIGRVGSTGRSTGPHLHYEIRRDDDAFNPMPHIRLGAEIRDLI
jgi:murein DD-endopeptidase MepM/ murein hydrolase activator NlpD